MLIPVSIGAILLRSIEAFKLFDIVFYITGGGPGGATSTATLGVFYGVALGKFRIWRSYVYGAISDSRRARDYCITLCAETAEAQSDVGPAGARACWSISNTLT